MRKGKRGSRGNDTDFAVTSFARRRESGRSTNYYPIHEVGWVIIIQQYQYKVQELPHDLVATGLYPIRVIALTYVKNSRPVKITDTVNIYVELTDL